jgi:hypothetical protein
MRRARQCARASLLPRIASVVRYKPESPPKHWPSSRARKCCGCSRVRYGVSSSNITPKLIASPGSSAKNARIWQANSLLPVRIFCGSDNVEGDRAGLGEKPSRRHQPLRPAFMRWLYVAAPRRPWLFREAGISELYPPGSSAGRRRSPRAQANIVSRPCAPP